LRGTSREEIYDLGLHELLDVAEHNQLRLHVQLRSATRSAWHEDPSRVLYEYQSHNRSGVRYVV